MGDIEVEGETYRFNHTALFRLRPHLDSAIKIKKGERILIIGGEPFAEEILIGGILGAHTR